MSHLSPQVIKGMIYMIIALFMFATVNALVKDVMVSYPLMQVIFFRFFFALIPIFFMIQQSGGLKTLKTCHAKTYVFCGALAVFDLVMLFEAFKKLPLADANAFVFTTILFITLLSYPLLREPVGVHRWMAVLLGFAGVLIMANPTDALSNPGIIYCLVFAFGDALIMVLTRRLSRTDLGSTIVFHTCIVATVISCCFLPTTWVTPTASDALKLIFLGMGAGSAQLFLTAAYRHAEATQIAPMIYTSILWSAFYDYYFWNNVPGPRIVTGAFIIILAGMYLIYWERRQSMFLYQNSLTQNHLHKQKGSDL